MFSRLTPGGQANQFPPHGTSVVKFWLIRQVHIGTEFYSDTHTYTHTHARTHQHTISRYVWDHMALRAGWGDEERERESRGEGKGKARMINVTARGSNRSVQCTVCTPQSPEGILERERERCRRRRKGRGTYRAICTTWIDQLHLLA